MIMGEFNHVTTLEKKKSCQLYHQENTMIKKTHIQDKQKNKHEEIVAKASDGQRYPCPAQVGCD